jgi:hypothetical protein
VRILLVGMSNLLCNIIIAALSQAPDIAVAGNVGDHEDIDLQIRLTSADAVIFQSTEPGSVENFASLLRHSPALKVVAIDGAANSGFVHQLRLCSIRLAELSAESLQSALRAEPGR